MAKWGQGDPRWIVEERADAKNVNNWHWTEKNATQWSKDLITKLLLSVNVENQECERKIGDNRTNFTGKLEVLNLSEEFSVDELEVSVSCTSSSVDGDLVKKFVQTAGVHEVKLQLAAYLKQLKEEYSKNIILPTKNCSQDPSVHTLNISSSKPSEPKRDAVGLISNHPKDLTVKQLTFTDEFFCTPSDLFKVLTTKELVQAFTRGESVVNPVEGGKYSIFGDNITGTFISLVPSTSIEMLWRKREWPEGHHSNVSIALAPCESGTRLTLTQTGVPGYDLENTTSGWRSNFFAALKQTYGYGGRMF